MSVSNKGGWRCPKCSNTEYDTGQFSATGGGFSKFLDIQNKRFSTVTCTRCQFTEIYRAETRMLENIFDFFTSN